MPNRRDFLRTGALAAGALAAAPALRRLEASPLHPPAPPSPEVDPATRDLMMEALNAAKLAGAGFADVRIGRYLQNFVQTREQQIVNVVDT
ncbi:MAG TPA: twin-arginine translocation signal domain-containing protein, partial [Gemmatimonadaceae bacterium]